LIGKIADFRNTHNLLIFLVRPTRHNKDSYIDHQDGSFTSLTRSKKHDDLADLFPDQYPNGSSRNTGQSSNTPFPAASLADPYASYAYPAQNTGDNTGQSSNWSFSVDSSANDYANYANPTQNTSDNTFYRPQQITTAGTQRPAVQVSLITIHDPVHIGVMLI
jgi:hypothetical protein